MADRDKVINGLRHHKEGDCDIDCPYYVDDDNCSNHLYEDALALLREDGKPVPRPSRPAHLMTEETVLSQPEGVVVWREFRLFNGQSELRPMVCDGKGRCGDFGLSVECRYDFTYRHYVRYWTNRPTDEQREAVKWE